MYTIFSIKADSKIYYIRSLILFEKYSKKYIYVYRDFKM